jgi:hypothetical protein
MATLMNDFDLPERLESSRERLLMALEPLPDEALLQPGAVGQWSIADLLAHLAAWESELITALMRLKQGRKPERFLQATANREAYNAQRYAENKARDLDRIFADFQGARVHLEQWLEDFSRRELTEAGRYKWLGRETLAQVIARYTCEHEEEHTAAVAAFAQLWLEQNPANNAESNNRLINLGDIGVNQPEE